jgi:hypothetical protein
MYNGLDSQMAPLRQTGCRREVGVFNLTTWIFWKRKCACGTVEQDLYCASQPADWDAAVAVVRTVKPVSKRN